MALFFDLHYVSCSFCYVTSPQRAIIVLTQYIMTSFDFLHFNCV